MVDTTKRFPDIQVRFSGRLSIERETRRVSARTESRDLACCYLIGWGVDHVDRVILPACHGSTRLGTDALYQI